MAGYPGVAYRPRMKEQLRRDPDRTWGNSFGGSNCGCAVDAMGLDRATLGKLNLSPADVREILGDRSGGTNLSQSDKLYAGRGIVLDVLTPGRFSAMEAGLYAGRGANLAGYYAPVQGTKYQGSETFTENHRIWVNEGRGWARGADGLWHAEEFLVFDPLADARRDGIDDGPTWWPRSLVYSFAWRLDVSDPAEPYRALGKGLVYVGLTKDTEPHVLLRFGGIRTTPFPDRTRGVAPIGKRINVRPEPNRSRKPVRTIARGGLFIAWQKTSSGEKLAGSRVWYGNQDGDEWIHSANLGQKGGAS